MNLSGWVGRLMKRFLLAPRLRRLTWKQVAAGVAVSAERFARRVKDAPEAGAVLPGAGGMSLADMAAHLAAANRLAAARLDALRAGQASPPPADLYPGAGAWTFAEAQADLRDSERRLLQAAARPIMSEATIEDAFYGPLSAREVLAAVAAHYAYHLAQAERIMRAPEYRKAQGAKW